MGIANSHQISRYYDFFRDKEIIFTKANIQILKMDPRQIYVKCAGGQWPCLINSSSLQSAKIILGTNSGAFIAIQKDKNISIQLRYCFIDANGAPIHFFVNCTVGDINKYQNTEELAVVTLNFTQRPPDDLIFKIGEFLEANENFYHRKEDRIDINKNSIRKLGLEKEESIIFIENVPRRCILKDLSFSGAKVMLVGVPKFLVGKNIALKIDFIDTNESVLVPGIIPRAEFLEGRKDITSVHIAFNGDTVPMVYKLHINSFITTYQKTILNNQNGQAVPMNQPVINTAAETASQPIVDTITRKNPEEQVGQAQPQVQPQPQVQTAQPSVQAQSQNPTA
ncbi:MAG: PilZ domain-containing protein [Treponema sp.]|nr:PilZ domain-containing protein [Treponema sp.]